MRKTILTLFTVLVLTACKTDTTKETETENQPQKKQVDLTKYPQGLQDVFTAHGGLQQWSDMQTMTYNMPKESGDETHTIDLKSRDVLIETANYRIGSAAGKVWIAQDTVAFPVERARFYHNLMFYFYAMPFILADDGIVYSDAQPLAMDGIIYPGIKIGYKPAVGDSPDDEYVLYYHPETKKMTYLSYTVTYGKDAKSPDFKYIKYSDWQEVNGLLLPKTLNWYHVENNLPTTPQTTGPYANVTFNKVDVDAAPMNKGYYNKPTSGVFVD